MKVRIRRMPPSRILEGVDLRPYEFQVGRVYECEPRVANVLMLWECAEFAERPNKSNMRRTPEEH